MSTIPKDLNSISLNFWRGVVEKPTLWNLLNRHYLKCGNDVINIKHMVPVRFGSMPSRSERFMEIDRVVCVICLHIIRKYSQLTHVFYNLYAMVWYEIYMLCYEILLQRYEIRMLALQWKIEIKGFKIWYTILSCAMIWDLNKNAVV